MAHLFTVFTYIYKCFIWSWNVPWCNSHIIFDISVIAIIFVQKNSTLLQVFKKIGQTHTFLYITPLILDLEHITISPDRIHCKKLLLIYSKYDCKYTVLIAVGTFTAMSTVK